MSHRVRHCIECTKCLTRYVLGFSPYRNGSYVVAMEGTASEELKLYCRCCSPPVCSWRSSEEMQVYIVSTEAARRGYGSADEILPLGASRRLSDIVVRGEATGWHSSSQGRGGTAE